MTPRRFSQVKAPKDLLAGVIFVILGLLTVAFAQNYAVGTAVEMGPGYFPAVVGLMLAAIGVGAIVRGMTSKVADPITPHRLQPLFLIFAAIVAFAVLIEPAGLLVASAALIAIACWPRLRENWREVLAIYVSLTGFCAIVFVYFFEMQLPLLPQLGGN